MCPLVVLLLRTTRALGVLSASVALIGACTSGGPVFYGCSDPEEITPSVDGVVTVDLASPAANAIVALTAAFQLSCDQFDIDDTFVIRSVTVADPTSSAAPTPLAVGYPTNSQPSFQCRKDAVIPGETLTPTLVDLGTPNATLAPLCFKPLTLSITIGRPGCSGPTTEATRSSSITFDCNGAQCAGKACGTNEQCCSCTGTPTCLNDCASFGCTTGT
ncbi:MAG: hypothetical protein ACHREM_19800 [Polyangiales bacterium]